VKAKLIAKGEGAPVDFTGETDDEAQRFSATERFAVAGKIGLLIIAATGLGVLAALSISYGAYTITVRDILTVLHAHLIQGNEAAANPLFNTIVWNIRLPRVLLCMVVGTALSSAGAVFQGCFRNPLVEPYILGVSSGAACGAAVGIVFPWLPISVQVLAFAGGALAVACTCTMARVRGQMPTITLILAGIVVGAVFSALVGIMKYMAQDAALREIVFWLMGGFYYVTWDDVRLIAPIIAGCFLFAWTFSWKLNVLSMGDEEARSLGVNPEKVKLVLLTLATLMTALAVSVVGIIAWVGLMVPHAARMTTGPDHRFVLPLASLLGGGYLIVCDTMARTLTSAEIPVGIITSLAGAPYLFFLLRAKGKAAFGA